MYGKLAPALVLVVIAAAMARPTLLFAQDEPCAVSDDDLAIGVEEQAAIDAINGLREAAGLPSLMVSESLMRPAAWKARAMADGAPFDHNDPFRSFVQRLADCGVFGEQTVENLAGGVVTGTEVALFWYNDPTGLHQQPLLDPLVQWIGIARTVDAQGSVYWCAVFSP
jgi:uncharacterized protein YkwD